MVNIRGNHCRDKESEGGGGGMVTLASRGEEWKGCCIGFHYSEMSSSMDDGDDDCTLAKRRRNGRHSRLLVVFRGTSLVIHN